MGTAARITVLVVCVAAPSAALAQRVPFERTMDISAPATLDVSTVRGKIEIVAGPAGRISVAGAATVRVGWDVPPNAEEIARRVAAAPPIEQVGNSVRLRIPTERDAQRAVTVSYRVEVPPETRVQTASNSGETSIRGVTATVEVRTQSGAIDLGGLSGTVQISTGSGAVTAGEISGPLSVTTTSSSLNGSRLRSSFRARTKSGDIDATFDGNGDVDVETGSSAITLRGVRGGLMVKSQSGRVTVQGTPTAAWVATTSSSSVSFELTKGHGFEVDAESRSGSVALADARLSGSVTKRSAKGTVDGGGPLVRVRSGSGAIRIESADR
jgi:DUF4097 and DUF4098 domain-containing protein YvlB